METIVRKKAVRKVDHYVNETIYKTTDGSEFTDESKAKKHQDNLDKAARAELQRLEAIARFNKIKNIPTSTDLNYPVLDGIWYYISNEEDLKILKERFGWDEKSTRWLSIYRYGEPKVGDWISCCYEDGGDYGDTKTILTLSFVKEEMDQFFKSFEE